MECMTRGAEVEENLSQCRVVHHESRMICPRHQKFTLLINYIFNPLLESVVLNYRDNRLEISYYKLVVRINTHLLK
jgi:hypothetical protein